MNKNMFAVLMTLFIVFVGLQFAEPATAAKVVDHGINHEWDPQDGVWVKITWKTYQYNNNYIKTYSTVYTKKPKAKKYVLEWHETSTLAKVTKNSIKETYRLDSKICPNKGVFYDKTKLTAAQYYWRIFRHEITVF